MASPDTVASLNDVTKIYGSGDAQVRALRGVDLDLHPREVNVVLGPSGSGKTTLLNITGGIEAATSGTVKVGGVDLTGKSSEQLATVRRENVAFVFQFFNLIQTLTALENVMAIVELTSEGDRSELERKAVGALDSVGLTERADHFPGQMSGGQQQRVAIARALVTEPALLLCDEPTGTLDLDTGRQVLELLQGAAHREGRCVVIVTHNSGIAVMADRIIRFHEGGIQEVVSQQAGAARDVSW